MTEAVGITSRLFMTVRTRQGPRHHFSLVSPLCSSSLCVHLDETAASLLVDPNGIVYDSVTGLPIANAKVEMVDGANVPLPPQCVVSGQQGQVTDNTGFYRFDVDVTGNDPSCPLAGDELRLVVTARSRKNLPGIHMASFHLLWLELG